MADATTEWLRSGEYLPDFMRDFHDQKEVFKTIHEVVDRRNEKDGRGSYTDGLTWVAAHVYTVDVFLWMMARHGYTLQRSRKRVPFADLFDWLSGSRERRRQQYGALLRESFAAARERSEHLSPRQVAPQPRDEPIPSSEDAP